MIGREDGGAPTIWLLGMAIATVLFTALVVDTSRVLAATTEAGDIADAAGRAAATAVNPVTGELDRPAEATRRAEAVLADAGLAGDIDVHPRRVVVTITTTVELPLLSVVGVPTRTVTARRATLLIAGA